MRDRGADSVIKRCSHAGQGQKAGNENRPALRDIGLVEADGINLRMGHGAEVDPERTDGAEATDVPLETPGIDEDRLIKACFGTWESSALKTVEEHG